MLQELRGSLELDWRDKPGVEERDVVERRHAGLRIPCAPWSDKRFERIARMGGRLGVVPGQVNRHERMGEGLG